MGGSSGGSGGSFMGRNASATNTRELLHESEREASDAGFGQKLAAVLGEQLAAANGRDPVKARERLDELLDVFKNEYDTVFEVLYGGSVAKHTYVDGLSDIDTLVVLNDSSLENETPDVVREKFAKSLRQQGVEADVKTGNMAVTVTYADGMVLQLLPAIQTATGVRVPSADGAQWSKVTKPEAFQEALTKLNNKCGGKLVPVIKLAKAIIGTLPEERRLSGYHMESLAIEAFKTYSGPYVAGAMLPAFFDQAKTLILNPIKDRSGQSRHVDDYMGDANSTARKSAGHLLDRLAKRMRVATATQNIQQWVGLFDRAE